MGRNNKVRRQLKKNEKAAKQRERSTLALDLAAAEIAQATTAEIAHALREFRENYADRWAVNAGSFEQDGHYEWMASFVKSERLVLEVGTGDGRSTLALIRDGHSVVGVDENTVCLDRAEARLKAAGVRVVRERRERVRATGGSGYALSYPRPVNKPEPGTALLLEADFASDATLEEWLAEVGPFDAVVCWCIGTHGAREHNDAVGSMDDKSYRLKIQNRVYEVADRILKPGGVLQTVDRAGVVSAEMFPKMLGAHEAQASVTSLKIEPRVAVRPYKAVDNGGCQMVFVVGPDGKVPDFSEANFTSILARKP
jgi:SAM-dependent methyltransferase